MCGTQTVATLIAVYGLFMTPLGWGYAAVVWGYALVWFLVTDRVKLLAYRILDPATATKTADAVAPPATKTADATPPQAAKTPVAIDTRAHGLDRVVHATTQDGSAAGLNIDVHVTTQDGSAADRDIDVHVTTQDGPAAGAGADGTPPKPG
ncbi:MAG: hypothetical protein M3Y74_20940 [Chloroflexota bacterium]|nr:hypothetical protein [Chloroflexota bacterium]